MKKRELYILMILIATVAVTVFLLYKNYTKTIIPHDIIETIPSDIVENNNDEDSDDKRNITLSLYFGNGEGLQIEERKIVVNNNFEIPIMALTELIKGPQNSDYSGTIPKGTKINSVNLGNGLAIVDLSKEFIDNHIGGSESEISTIYSVVNTLCDIPIINRVEFLIDGQKRSIFKHFTFDDIFTKNESIIEISN